MLFWYIVDHAKHGKCSEAFVFDQNRKLRARNVAKIPSNKRLYWCRGIASKVDVEQELHAYVHEDIHAPVGVKFQVLLFLGLIFAAVRVLASTLPNHVCFRSAKPAGDHAPNRSVLAHAHRLVRAQARSGTSRPGGNGKDGDLEGFGEGVVRSQHLFQFFLVVCSCAVTVFGAPPTTSRMFFKLETSVAVSAACTFESVSAGVNVSHGPSLSVKILPLLVLGLLTASKSSFFFSAC